LTFSALSSKIYNKLIFYLSLSIIPVLALDPVLGAIAAGNAVVLKPSEIAPATALLLEKLIEKYMDQSIVRVVQGAVDETTALLQQKWDKIFYTGFSSLFGCSCFLNNWSAFMNIYTPATLKSIISA